MEILNMTSLKEMLDELKNQDTDFSKITFKQIKESFPVPYHNPKDKIDLEYYEVSRACLKVLQNVLNDKKSSCEDQAKAKYILELFSLAKFLDKNILEENKNILEKNKKNRGNKKLSTAESTLLYLLIENNSEEEDNSKLIELMINNGIKEQINAKNEYGKTSLHCAALWENLKAINLLIKSGANVDAKDEKGYTPLHWATLWGKIKSINTLREHGASVSAKDEDGKTPLDFIKYLEYTSSKKQAIMNALEKELSNHQANGTKDTLENTLLNNAQSLDTENHTTPTIILAKNNRSEHQRKTACYTTAIFTTITAITLFTTGTVASTPLNVTYAAGIIALSTFIISNLVYGIALEIYSTPSPKLENTEIVQSIVQTQVPSAA